MNHLVNKITENSENADYKVPSIKLTLTLLVMSNGLKSKVIHFITENRQLLNELIISDLISLSLCNNELLLAWSAVQVCHLPSS